MNEGHSALLWHAGIWGIIGGISLVAGNDMFLGISIICSTVNVAGDFVVCEIRRATQGKRK